MSNSNKLIVVMGLIISLLILSTTVSALPLYEVNTTSITATSLTYTFTPSLTPTTEVWFDHTQIEDHTLSTLTMNTLTPDTSYTLILYDTNTTDTQEITTTTASQSEEPFYAQYGIIGLFLLIVAMLYISQKVPFVGYATMALSFLGFMYIVKSTDDFITALIFVILFFASMLTSLTGSEK